MKVLYHGFDQLDVSFKGALGSDAVEALEAAKERARENMAPEYLEWNGLQGHVKETGAKGGYAYVYDTGPDGETWTFKASPNATMYNIRVSVRSAQLAVKGYFGVKDHLIESLGRFGVGYRPGNESVARVDYAMDFEAPEFHLNPYQFVCHSRAGVSPEGYGLEAFKPHMRGRACESVTVGKMPGRQVIVYDKRKEAMLPGKAFWFDIWGVTREDCPQVWRVEVRAGKKHLDDWNLKTFMDIEGAIGDVFTKAMQSVRYMARECRPGETVTRIPMHDLWRNAMTLIVSALWEHSSGVVQGRIVAGRRREIASRLEAQVHGLCASLAVARGMSVVNARDMLPKQLARRVGDFLHSKDFRAKFGKAERRMFFLNEMEVLAA